MNASNTPQFKRADVSDHSDPWPKNAAKWLFESIDEINRLSDELAKLISEAQDERPLQNFFKHNPGLLVQLVRGGHGRWVFPKPKLGSEHVPDFMICEQDSGGYHWHLVELENPNYVALTKQGQQTAHLTHAIQQVKNWRIWLRDNSRYAQHELGYADLDSEFHAIIVIGRRNELDPEDLKRYRELSDDKVEIMSYDRLIDRVVSLAKGYRRHWDQWLSSGKETES